MDELDLKQIVTRLLRLERKRREAKRDIEVLRQELSDELYDRGLDEMKVGRFIVREKEYTRDVFDTKLFKEQQPIAYDAYCKPQTVTKLEVLG